MGSGDSNKSQGLDYLRVFFCQVEILQSANIATEGVFTKLKDKNDWEWGKISMVELFFLMEYNRKGLMAAWN